MKLPTHIQEFIDSIWTVDYFSGRGPLPEGCVEYGTRRDASDIADDAERTAAWHEVWYLRGAATRPTNLGVKPEAAYNAAYDAAWEAAHANADEDDEFDEYEDDEYEDDDVGWRVHDEWGLVYIGIEPDDEDVAMFGAVEAVARHAAWEAVMDKCKNEADARAAAENASGDAILLAICLLMRDRIDPKHLDYARQRWAIWQAGYGVAAEFDGTHYCYRRPY